MNKFLKAFPIFFIVSGLVLLFFLFFVNEVSADIQSFNSSADSYVGSGTPNTNHGSAIAMDLVDNRDGVVRFDISAIPSGSTITSATLTLVATAVGSATAVKNYGVHRILVDWAEGTVTWNTPGSTTGTHFASSPTEIIAASVKGTYSWNVTNDVASFVNGSAANYGWRIIWSSNTSGTSKQVDFGTKENTTLGNRPVLSVTYTPSTPSDTTAPAAVSNLAASNPSNSAITVSWTAPGDDGNTGIATTYDLRYSTSNITESNWSSATQVTGEPTPSVAGSSESKTVSGLSASTAYYFAIKISDEVPNESDLSNVPSLATTDIPDITVPAAVTNLALSNPYASSMTVTWTAPGDDGNTGTATSYDLRYSTATITEANWSSATQVSGEPSPSAAGSSQSKTVFGLSASTAYYFALKISDEVPNESGISNVPSLATLASGEQEEEEEEEEEEGGGGKEQRIMARFSGQAYPGCKIEVLKKRADISNFITVPIEELTIFDDGKFEIILKGLINTNFLFALRVEDKDGRKTGIISFDVDMRIEDLIAENIFVPPTVGFDKTVVTKGQELKIEGYAAPNNKIEIDIDNIITGETQSDGTGYWTLNMATHNLNLGTRYIRARQIDQSGRESGFSFFQAFKVSLLELPRADFNNDNKVDITDWSIFLYRWGSGEESIKSKIDMNDDGNINIEDFSIFLKTIKI